MFDLTEVSRIADKAASAVLKKSELSRVFSDYMTDSDGRDALLVTIVLHDYKPGQITGDRALDTIMRIKQDLSRAGEERFALVEFATEEELSSDGDPEP